MGRSRGLGRQLISDRRFTSTIAADRDTLEGRHERCFAPALGLSSEASGCRVGDRGAVESSKSGKRSGGLNEGIEGFGGASRFDPLGLPTRLFRDGTEVNEGNEALSRCWRILAIRGPYAPLAAVRRKKMEQKEAKESESFLG